MDAQTKKRETVISPTPTDERVMVPPEIPHDARTCIEDLDFDESDSDELREEREMQDDVHDGMRRLRPLGSKRHPDFQGLRMESDEDPDGEVLTMYEWKQLCVEMDRLEGAMEHETEESSSACDGSYADNECKGTDINGETLHQEASKKRGWTAHHVFAGGRQVHFDDTMNLSAPDT